MVYDRDIDRRNARLAETARDLVRSDNRRIIIVGAKGWIGRTTLALLHEALGSAGLVSRTRCFGSTAARISLEDGTAMEQQPLSQLGRLPPVPSIVLHLAFLTKDKVAGMTADAYERQNRALSDTVRQALGKIGADRLFVASSGAAGFADDGASAADLRLYGRMKRADEEAFAAWAMTAPDHRRATIGRIYSVTGPFINKHETYAIASFIAYALARRPIEVHAPMRVLRSYVAVREVVSLIFAQLLERDAEPVLRFETGGEALELGEVAQVVAELTQATVLRRPVSEPGENRYVGDDEQWRRHLAQFGMTPVPLIEQIAETIAYLARRTP